jgi:hypothetical protein
MSARVLISPQDYFTLNFTVSSRPKNRTLHVSLHKGLLWPIAFIARAETPYYSTCSAFVRLFRLGTAAWPDHALIRRVAGRDSVGACHGLPMLGVNARPRSNRHGFRGPAQAVDIEAGSDHTRGRGHDGQHPYRETKCFRRLQQTTSVKNRAHGAHAADHVEDEGLTMGSIEIHTVPMAAHASIGVWTPVGLRWLLFGWEGDGKCLKRFGGPGEIRTYTLD